MANEAKMTCSLSINKGNLNYQSRPGQFQADVAIGKGPTPGAFTVTSSGTDADLSELDTPGLYRMQNLDDVESIEWGIWDGASFVGVGLLLPGETFIGRLSAEFSIGTTSNVLRFFSSGDPCDVLLEVFES